MVCSRGSPRTSPYLWSDFESFSLSVHSTLLTLAIVQASNALIMLFFFYSCDAPPLAASPNRTLFPVEFSN